MKKLYLIGDSIRMGYCEYVKIALKGKADVYWNEGNARFAEYVLYSIGDWEHKQKIGEDTACVHWNAGLHDVIRTMDEDPLTPTEIYGYYIDRICQRLKKYYPNAVQIFATSTPVQEELYDYWFSRKNSDIDAINAEAVKIVKKYGIEVNDLNALLKNQPKEFYSDKTHFHTPAAREIITKAVLKSVCPALGIDYDELEMPDFNIEMIADDKEILK